MFNRQSKAFTLIELLVVIAIIALLVSILLPSLNRAKDLAKRVICSSNLHNVAIASVLYATENNDAFAPRYYVWNPHHVRAEENKMGFQLAVDGGYIPDINVLFCPADSYTPEDFWPYLGNGIEEHYCSFAQREETRTDDFRLSNTGGLTFASDRFYHVPGSLNYYPVSEHGDGWNVVTFDGTARWQSKTDEIWDDIAWSSDFSAQAVTWYTFDEN